MNLKKNLGADWLRANFDDGQRFLAVSILCGVLCGVVAVLFHHSIEFIFHNLWHFASHQNPIWFGVTMVTAPTLGGLLVGVCVKNFAPNAVGSGIPQTKVAFYNKRGMISSLEGFWRFILGSLYVGLGNSLGREGPTVHVCSSIASKLGRWAFRSPARKQAIVPVGMAAGISAAFNAPISAITFVFEELLDKFSMKSIGAIMISVVIAAVISRLWLGEEPVITTLKGVEFSTELWMFVAIPLGVLAGYFGHFFVRSVLTLRGRFKRNKTIPFILKPAIGGFCCGIFGITAYYLTGLASAEGVAENGVFSIGYESLQHAFEGKLSLLVLLVLLVFKTLAVVLNYASGGSGGLFSPTLFIGGTLGGVVGTLLTLIVDSPVTSDSQIIGGCVLLGMGAMFGSVIRCPFTSIFMIYELTGNYTLILPLMFGNILSWQIARNLGHVSLYNALLIQDKINIRKFPAYRGSQDYRNLPVSTIMTHEPYALRGELSCKETREKLKAENVKHHGYPVLTQEDEFIGLLMHHELYENPDEMLVSDLTKKEELISATPETSIRTAAREMIKYDYQQMPVVSKLSSERLIGFLTLNDIARQQNASDEDEIDLTVEELGTGI